MICETCEGEGYVRGSDSDNPGALVMLPCLECMGSGIVSCCDAAGSARPDDDPCAICGLPWRQCECAPGGLWEAAR